MNVNIVLYKKKKNKKNNFLFVFRELIYKIFITSITCINIIKI